MTAHVFDGYAAYYDLLYREKDYAGEAHFVLDTLTRYGGPVRRLVEFGCGTGAHAEHFAAQGIDAEGVDRSEPMLEAARARAKRLGAAGSRLGFTRADIQRVRLGKTFDAVVSLFHVFSYQTTNQQLLDTMESARMHLSAGGLLLFDAWYGPGVLTDLPRVRVKRLSDDRSEISRIAEPRLLPTENVVDVHYTVFVRSLDNGTIEELTESHRMRYLFVPEVQLMLASRGFDLLEVREWMTGAEPTAGSWTVYFMARAT